MLASPLHDRPMPLPRRIGLGIEVVEVLARPKAAVIADCEITASHIEGDCIGRVGLQLEGMGTGVSLHPQAQRPSGSGCGCRSSAITKGGCGGRWVDRRFQSS